MMNWTNALAYCDNLNTHPSGHTDWYFPTRQEFAIIDLKRSTAPAIVIGSTIFTSVVSNYWTSSTYMPSTTVVFLATLSLGTSGNGVKASRYYVACARRNY